MKYCSECGSAKIVHKIPEGDNLPRYVCENCHMIHYQNPKIVAGCLPEWEDKLLLCRRAIEPRYGLWTLPAGFMENQESIEQAALRETREEAQARVKLAQLYAVYSVPHINQVHMLFRGQLTDLNFAAGTESLDVRLFSYNEIPWQELAFAVIVRTLKHYFADRAKGHFELHVEDVIRPLDKQVDE